MLSLSNLSLTFHPHFTGRFSHMIPVVRSSDWPHAKPIEFIQRPGEIVYVPGGWHHVVINVEDTVAVTQNFCSYVSYALASFSMPVSEVL
jgi:oxalate decarboxylase/phosphoglucose isomerase-like protein (cupin superfamily)